MFCLVVNKFNHIFAGTQSGRIYLSIDRGEACTQTRLTNSQIKTLAIGADRQIFAGTDGQGVFQSVDNGKTWIPLNGGLKTARVLSLAGSSNGYIYAGTDEGVYRSTQSTTSVARILNDRSHKFLLEQNYPNPFNVGTTFRFELHTPTNVTLKLYNILGEEVTTLIKDEKMLGKCEVNWIAKGLASGLYFYRLKAGEFIKTRKFILFK